MIRAVRVVAPVALASVLAVLVLTAGTRARAADAKAVAAEIEAHDKAFLAAYENGETKKMKAEIGKAISLGEKNGLGSDAVMADTYVLAAIFNVDGNDDAKAGVRDFVKALKIKPDVAIPRGMATSPVKAALKQARIELGLLSKDGAPVAATAQTKPGDESTAKPKADDEAAEKARAEAQAKQEKQAREERERQDKEKAAEAKQAQAKADQQAAELAQKEKTDRADKASKAEADRQTGDLKARVRELEKEKAGRDKQLADAQSRIQQLEKDKADLERQRADRDKQLADARARNQQLERERTDKDKQLADKDKQLADARTEQSKSREALDKIARDQQAAEAQARDAENKRKQEREQRERLFAGPDMPARLTEALTCAIPDEAPLRTDLFVHCVARPNVKARSIIFYYRAGSAHYYSVPMERTTKGWYAALVPGIRVVGKVMQYYAEALDGREAVVAHNGKENSPNILMLRPGGPRG
jgi:hypothetical protein